MKQPKGKVPFWMIEDEHIERRLSGERITPEESVNKYPLESQEKAELIRNLNMWEKSMSGFDEFLESFDSGAVFQEFQNRIDSMQSKEEQSIRTSLWRRIRNSVKGGREAIRDKVREALEVHILNLPDAVALTAGVYYGLPDIERPNMKISIHFAESKADETRGTLYVSFELLDDRNVKALNGIRLTLCNPECVPLTPKKQDKIQDMHASFLDVDLTKQYTIQVS